MTESVHVYDDGIRLTEVQRLEKRLGEWQEDYFTLYNEKERLLGRVIKLEAELATLKARTCDNCYYFYTCDIETYLSLNFGKGKDDLCCSEWGALP